MKTTKDTVFIDLFTGDTQESRPLKGPGNLFTQLKDTLLCD